MDKRDLLDRLAANGDERLLLGRVWDKYEQCRRRNIPVVTGFLSPAEQEPVRRFLLDSWDSAGRVRLKVQPIGPTELQVPEEKVKLLRDTVSSLRLDSVLSVGFSLSRSKAAEAVTSGKVQVNWADWQKPDRQVVQGDVLTLRGLGKCVLEEVGNQTKKGRVFITVKRYL